MIRRWLYRLFCAAVRTEVDRAMADRRRALQAQSIDEAEAQRIARFLASQGVRTTGPAEILPFPVANDRHVDPPSPAA